MPKYRLTYFSFRARAEVPRMLFRLADQECEDVVVNICEEWPEFQKTTKFGQLPMLEEDGKIISQSFAICRYLARKYGYAGKTDWEQAKVDMIADCVADFVHPGFPIYLLNMNMNMKKDESLKPQKEAAVKKYAEQIPVFMEKFEKLLSESKSGYFVGDEMTWADMMFAEGVIWPQPLAGLTVDLDKYPKCKTLQDKVHSHPVIAKYLAERWPQQK